MSGSSRLVGSSRALFALTGFLALCGALVQVTGLASADEEPSGFDDVPDDHVFADEVAWLASTGITQGRGDGTYGINDPVTRGAMAAFLYRYDGQPGGPFDAPDFDDVPNNHTFATEIAWLASTGITQGRGDGTYGINDPVTRGAMAAFLYRYERWEQRELSVVTSRLPDAAAGLSFGVRLEASSGAEPYGWEASGLPPGLSVDAEGRLSGVPVEVGVWPVEVEVTDAAGAVASATLEVEVLEAFVPAACFGQDCALLDPFDGDEVELDDGTVTTRRTIEPDASEVSEFEVDGEVDEATGQVSGTARVTLSSPWSAVVDDVVVVPAEAVSTSGAGPVFVQVVSVSATQRGVEVAGDLVGLMDAYVSGTVHMLDASSDELGALSLAQSPTGDRPPRLACETEGDQRLEAGLEVVPDIDVFVNWRFGVPTRLDVQLDVQVDADALIAVSGEVSCSVEGLPSATVVKGPAVVRLAPAVALEATGAAQVELQASYGCAGGFGYRNDRDAYMSCTSRGSELILTDEGSINTARATARIDLKPSITMVDVFGVRGTLSGQLDAHLTPLADPIARLDLSAPTKLEGCVGCDLPRIGDVWSGTFLEHTHGPTTIWQLAAPRPEPDPAPEDPDDELGRTFAPIAGLAFALPPPPSGEWGELRPFDPPSSGAWIALEEFMTTVAVRHRSAPSIGSILTDQEALYREFGYDVPDPWHEEIDIRDTDRAVTYVWLSPSGDVLRSTVLLEIDGEVIEISQNAWIDDVIFDHAPSSEEFLDVVGNSLSIDRDRLLAALRGSDGWRGSEETDRSRW